MDVSKLSDEELEKIAKGNDYSSMSDEELEKLANPPSKTESAIRGAAQGASLGFADEITGALESALTDKTYEQARNESRENYKRAKDENPNTYLAGEVGGGLATAAIPVGGAATLGRAAILGAGMGGAAGLGSSEAEDLAGMSKDTLKGAGLGAVGGTVGYGIAKAVPWAAKSTGEKLKWLAEQRAVKALGGSKKAMERLKSVPDAESRLGRTLLDEGVVTPFAGKEKMAERLADVADDRVGQLTGELDRVSQLQNAVSPDDAIRLENAKFSPTEAAQALKDKIAQEYAHIPQAIRDKQGAVIDEWLSNPGRMDIKDAQAFKTQMQKWIKDPSYHQANPNAAQETLLGIRNQIKTGIERNADEAANILGEQGGKIKSINQDLGGVYQGQDMLEDAIARGAKNRTFSLTDYIGANAGAAAAGPKGIAFGIANKVAREKGSQVIASGADKVSKFLLQSPKMQKLAATNPPAFKSIAQAVAQRVSEQGSKVAGPTQQPVDDERAKQSFLDGN